MANNKKIKYDVAIVDFKLRVVSAKDHVTECIDAISQIMEQSSLSMDGKDKRAVYAWFVERYRPGILFGKDDI